MARNLELLLTENVDNLGIVGDVVRVRSGYARNFLLPRRLATTPSEEAIKAVAAKRAEAQRMLAELRKQREEMTEKMKGIEVTLIRSCNDQGVLYAAITQEEIASALGEKGFVVKPREVRIGQPIKHIDSYDIQVKFDSDLTTAIKLWVVADRKLDLEKPTEAAPPADAEQPAEVDEKPAKKAKGEGKPAEAEAKRDARPAKADAKHAKAETKATKGESKAAAKGEAGADEKKKAKKGG